MRRFAVPLFILFSSVLIAQVGIQTDAPKATLEISKRVNDNNVSSDGLIIPRLSKIELANKVANTYGQSQLGAIVYVNDITNPVGSPASLSQVVSVNAIGFYYFDGSIWRKLSASAGGDSTDDAWINDQSNSRVHLGSSSSGSVRNTGSEVVVKDNGNLGVGLNDPLSKLHVNGGARITTLPKAAVSSTPVYWNSTTGELQSYENLKKPFNRLKYSIRLINSDWVSDLNTNINSTNYTIIITSASFKYLSGGPSNPAYGIGHTNYSNNTGNPTANVYPFISNNTWRIYADYPNAAPLSSINGSNAIYQWDFDVMIIDNNTVKILEDKVNLTAQGGTTWEFSAPSDL